MYPALCFYMKRTRPFHPASTHCHLATEEGESEAQRQSFRLQAFIQHELRHAVGDVVEERVDRTDHEVGGNVESTEGHVIAVTVVGSAIQVD